MRESLRQENKHTMNNGIWDTWRAFIAERFGVTLAEKAVDDFKVYLRELEEWNLKMNLVSFHSPEEVLWRHFADSLAGFTLAGKCLPQGPWRAADLGTGAGFPGFAMKIADPSLSLTLVESITKKASFLEHMKETLAVSGLDVINERAEVLGQKKEYRESFDLVLSRAVSKFSPNLEIAIPFLRIGGIALIYKTERSLEGPEGLASVERAAQVLGARLKDRFCYSLPGADQNYCVLAFEKISVTPPPYPRRPGVPEKKPL